MLGFTASIGAVFWFLSVVLKITSEWMPIYIPICVDLGIFLGVSISHIWSQSRDYIRRLLYSILGSISQSLGVTEADIEMGRTVHGRHNPDDENPLVVNHSNPPSQSSLQPHDIVPHGECDTGLR